MKMKKKIISCLLAVSMVATLAVPAFAAGTGAATGHEFTLGMQPNDDATRNVWQGIISLDPGNELGSGESHIDGSAEGYGFTVNGTTVTDSTTKVTGGSAGDSMAFVSYLKVPDQTLSTVDSVSVTTNGRENEANLVNKDGGTTWCNNDDTNLYMKWGTTFAQNYGGTWYLVADKFNQVITLKKDGVAVKTINVSVDMSGVTGLTKMTPTSYAAAVSFDLTAAERGTWQTIIDLDPSNELGAGYQTGVGYGFTVGADKKVTGATTTTRLDASTETPNASFVSYAKLTGKKIGTDFDKVVFKRNGVVTDTFSDANTSWIKVDGNDTYMKWGNHFATKDGATWYRDYNQFTQVIEFYEGLLLVGKQTFTVDFSGVTSPAMKPAPTPPPTPSYGGGGGSYSPSDTTADVSANTPTGTEATIDSSVTNIANPVLDVKPVAANSVEVESFIKAASGFAVASVFNINMFDSTTVVKQVEGGKVEITLPFVAPDTSKQYVVLRYNDDKTVTVIPATLDGSKIIFRTDHFSTFAVAVRSDNPNLFVDTAVKPTTPTAPSTVPATGVALLGKLF